MVHGKGVSIKDGQNIPEDFWDSFEAEGFMSSPFLGPKSHGDL